MPVTLHDSLTRSLKALRRPDPADPKDVFTFYNCGPTVYAPAHIGNFRTFVVNDLLRRVLELEFGPGKVKHVRNITDVDDKTIRRSREEGRPLAEVTKQWTDKFHADCAALNCLPPHVEPTATGHIPEQVGMIAELMQKGHAYASADGSVYFKVGSFTGYGALSRVKERELQVGSALAHKPQTADADEKEDGSDFALWKAWKPEDGDVKWPGPVGAAAGRPGWHIECSAMSRKHLGETIDLHTGGVDLLFPHHENEIAQSECCTGHTFARHWYHSEHLLVDGKKMSKSLGNMYTLADLQAKGFSPMALRYALLTGHPRKQLNFTLDSLHGAESALRYIESSIEFFCEKAGVTAAQFWEDAKTPSAPSENPWWHTTAIWSAITNDLNTPSALGELFTRLTTIRQGMASPSTRSPEDMKELLHGLRNVMFALGIQPTQRSPDVPSEVKTLAEQRWAAKQAKNWAEADRLRGAIAALGWAMLDSKTEYKLEPAKKA
jgi:cysteinyl-tRNA synthetase